MIRINSYFAGDSVPVYGDSTTDGMSRSTHHQHPAQCTALQLSRAFPPHASRDLLRRLGGEDAQSRGSLLLEEPCYQARLKLLETGYTPSELVESSSEKSLQLRDFGFGESCSHRRTDMELKKSISETERALRSYGAVSNTAWTTDKGEHIQPHTAGYHHNVCLLINE